MTDGTAGDDAGFLGEVCRLVEERETPVQLTPAEKERLRQRERSLLVAEITREVLRELGDRGQDRERFLRFLISGIKALFPDIRTLWASIVFALLRIFAPKRAIAHIESYMREPPFSEKGKAYWTGRSGERMQEQLRGLYRRVGRRY